MVTKLIPAIACALAALSLSSRVSAQLVLVDDFNDGNDAGWGHLDLLPGPFGPTVYNASSTRYNLASSQPIGPVPQQVPTAAFWGPSVSNAFFDDGVLDMRVRANNAQTNVFSMLRTNPGAGNAYAFSANTVLNQVYVSRISGFSITDLASAPLTFTPGFDYLLRASAIGSSLALKAWKVGDPEPGLPQISISDPAFASGGIGLGIFKWLSGPDGVVSADFDDVTFNHVVPAPGTAGLLALGLLARRRRR